MIQVGTVEARTHFNRLLQRVATGERILITKRGKPVAVLAPPEPEEGQDAAMVGREWTVKPKPGPGPTRSIWLAATV